MEEIERLREILKLCYSKDTAYPKDKEIWNINNPTCGQCAVTALIIQENFGGTINRIYISENETHYFNIINDKIIDLTKEQFDFYNIDIQYEPNELVSREKILANSNTNKRYSILKERLRNRNIN